MTNRSIIFILWYLLIANTTFAFSRQDSLRGSNGSGRSWWDVQHYELQINFDTTNKSILGKNIITLLVTDTPLNKLQLDLQVPMMLDSIKYGALSLPFAREGHVWWVNTNLMFWQKGETHQLQVFYHGKPTIAKLPPWNGGFIWEEDSEGNPWYSVACQGLGASSWWPCKDYQGDEPDSGMVIKLNVPNGLKAISNGRLITTEDAGSNNTFWHWQVTNPINTYNATFYIGNYASWTDTLMGEKGKLDITYHVLKQNEAKARKHFKVTKDMLHCFEYWMGPYPFYEDGYQLVEAPHLGMEHQSAIAYGNEYKMGYRGNDRSGTGVGTLFDFIIIHESGHEWFGNNITAQDITDNWIHEGFTTYTEALFAECAVGKEKAFRYTRGEWKNIRNDIPVCGAYGVHDHGSSDQYDKGSAIVHMIRMMIDDDEQFRQLLRGLNKDFYHQMVTSKTIEQYIMDKTGLELTAFFEQYLRTTNIPVLEWYIKDKELHYRFTNVVEGFSLPIKIWTKKISKQLTVTNSWQSTRWKNGGYNVNYSKDYLIKDKY